MQFPSILFPILLCTISPAMPVGAMPFRGHGIPLPTKAGPPPPEKAEIPFKNAVRDDSPAPSTRPRLKPDPSELPSLAYLMANSENYTITVQQVYYLEHYRYHLNLPPGYAAAYDAQRERNRTIADEIRRCSAIWSDCDDLTNHHHRIDMSDTCIARREAGEAVYDREMLIVAAGQWVSDRLESKKQQELVERKEPSLANYESKSSPWLCRLLGHNNCPDYNLSCIFWPFNPKCWGTFLDNSAKTIGKREQVEKPIVPWSIVGVGVKDSQHIDEYGNKIATSCTDTWVEPGTIGEKDLALIFSNNST